MGTHLSERAHFAHEGRVGQRKVVRDEQVLLRIRTRGRRVILEEDLGVPWHWREAV